MEYKLFTSFFLNTLFFVMVHDFRNRTVNFHGIRSTQENVRSDLRDGTAECVYGTAQEIDDPRGLIRPDPVQIDNNRAA
ncbi:hypothetical protein D3C86_2033290 [compost metagenome]